MSEQKETKNKKGYTHLTKAERNEIKILLEKGYKYEEIGKALKRDKSTISREISENSVKGEYDPEKANHKAYVKRLNASFRGKKIVSHPSLRKYVEEKLEKGWSPETISGRIENRKPDLPNASKDTIYRYLRSVYGNKVSYRIRKKKRRNDKRKTKLEDRKFIDQRPEEADLRAKPGHWEMDFLESGRSSKAALLVIVDRKTRFSLVRLLPNKKTTLVNKVVAEMIEEVLRKTITCDNDLSFQKHKELERMIEIPIFFCHPFTSSEKGSVEEVNGRLRKYFPKGTDFSKVSEEEVRRAVWEINDYPRKCLGYLKPREAMEEKKVVFVPERGCAKVK